MVERGAAAVLPVRARVTWAAVSWRYVDRMRAAIPATMPLDMQVVLTGVADRVVHELPDL
jgi:hypothetical protein